MKKLVIVVLFLSNFLSFRSMCEEQMSPKDIAPILKPILDESKLPAMSAAVLVGDELRGAGAVGVRKVGDDTAVTRDDKFHIGSCTKMLTATLAAILVEEGLLDWDTKISDVLGRRQVRDLHEDYRDVTVEQMLAHVGGFPENPPPSTWKSAWANQGKISAPKQRLEFIADVLALEPAYAPGSKTVYSNSGYAVVGVMLETLARKSWEDLIRERIFEPLEMKTAGFRAPCSEGQLDHPLGHQGTKPIDPDPDRADNPDAIGPAGTVHLSMPDFIKFANYHLQRKPGGILKKAESFDKLNSTLPNSGSHGVGGWLVHDIDRMGGHCLQMTGSNTMWYTMFWVFPGWDMAVVVSTNSAPANAFGTCDKAVAALIGEFKGKGGAE